MGRALVKAVGGIAVLLAGCTSMKDYASHSKATEAKVQLKKLELVVRDAVASDGELPKGTIGPTPTMPCCQQQGQRCAPDATDWTGLWQTLDFAIVEPFRFQYSYHSDGSTFTASALGDLECSGSPTALTLSGAIQGGKLVAQLREP